jgi:SAM-dependent methyltransferase
VPIDYQRLYEFRFRNVDQAHRVAVWREIAPFIHRELGYPERMLDPAAGLGEFINAVPARERWAVDQVAYADGTYAPEVRAIVSNIFEADLPDAHFDGVFVSNFLEHLTSQDDVGTFLARMRACLRSGGRIAIMGPNFRYTRREYFDMADHTLVHTHKAIVEHLAAAGFVTERVEPRFLPYSFSGRLPASPALVRRYLQTPAAWRVLGKQFLVIGRRP